MYTRAWISNKTKYFMYSKFFCLPVCLSVSSPVNFSLFCFLLYLLFSPCYIFSLSRARALCLCLCVCVFSSLSHLQQWEPLEHWNSPGLGSAPIKMTLTVPGLNLYDRRPLKQEVRGGFHYIFNTGQITSFHLVVLMEVV